jgi:hypothetical protein
MQLRIAMPQARLKTAMRLGPTQSRHLKHGRKASNEPDRKISSVRRAMEDEPFAVIENEDRHQSEYAKQYMLRQNPAF